VLVTQETAVTAFSFKDRTARYMHRDAQFIYCQGPGKDSIGPKGPDWRVGFVVRHEQ